MKEFKDLEFKDRVEGRGSQAIIYFNNGYGVSVITGKMFRTSYHRPYEMDILENGKLIHNTHITNDVLVYQKEEDITSIMKQVQELA